MASEVGQLMQLENYANGLFEHIKELDAQLKNDKGAIPTDENGDIIGDEKLVEDYLNTYRKLYDLGVIDHRGDNPKYEEFENKMTRLNQL